MAAKKILLACGAAILCIQSGLAIPVANEVQPILDPRANVTIDPPKNATPVVQQLHMTEQQLEQYIQDVKTKSKSSPAPKTNPTPKTNPIPTPKTNPKTPPKKTVPRSEQLGPRGTGTSGALLTFIEGETLPGSKKAGCKDFVINGPFTNLHFIMGSSNVRHISATSFGGVTTDIGNPDAVVDAGEIKFTDNERITKFSIGRTGTPSVSSFTFETNGKQSYSALSGLVKDGTNKPTYEDLPVGSGILARITGTYCDIGVMGSFGVDFLDDLSNIAISKIDYAGFTHNIMPSGQGTQMSVGSQVLDNRNSSEKQTITLTTTDAITRQTTIITQIRAQVGGSVSVEAGVGIPLLSNGKVSAESNWQLEGLTAKQEMTNAVTTRAGTFALVCPAHKFCTASAFFTQFKLDVNVNATFTATAKSGGTYSWQQSGTYSGADSMAMEFTVTEVDNAGP